MEINKLNEQLKIMNERIFLYPVACCSHESENQKAKGIDHVTRKK
jgi:hypothetical protein